MITHLTANRARLIVSGAGRVLFLSFLILFIAGCATPEPAELPETAPEAEQVATNATPTPTEPVAATATAEATEAASPSPEIVATDTAEPTAAPEQTTLTICTGAEPDTLYLFHGTSYLSRLIRQAVYDGPIDSRNYEYQPVILEKLPSLEDGDARIEPVTVQAGDRVVDAAGERVELAAGAVVFPAGCRDETCAVAYQGGPLEMDQLTADFTIREDVRWSDGEPVTAADSVYSYRTGLSTPGQFDPTINTAAAALTATRPNDPTPYTANYAAIDERTVSWTGLPGYFDPYYQLNFFSPLPQHQLGGASVEELPELDEAARRPMGWGPYVIEEWTPGDRLVAERNPNYFRAGEGLPYFDRLIFRFLPGAPADRLTALADGQCDVLALDALGFPYGEPVLEELVALEEAGAIHLYPIHGAPSSWEHLTFNVAPVDDRLPFFADVRVRRAVAHCLDRARLSEDLTFGLSPVPDTFAPPGYPVLAEAGIEPYAFDLERGRALLEEAGWVAAGDGPRLAQGVAGIADGTPLSVEMVTTAGNPLRADMVEIMAEDLRACGIELNARFLPAEELFAETAEGPIFGRHFDLAQFAWLAGVAPDCAPFTGDEIAAPGDERPGNNVAGYAGPAFDAACRAAQAAIPGSEAFAAANAEALSLFVEDIPALPLMTRVALAAARPDLEGLIIDPTQPLETWNIEEFRLAP